mgnify:CR=1 FL=1
MRPFAVMISVLKKIQKKWMTQVHSIPSIIIKTFHKHKWGGLCRETHTTKIGSSCCHFRILLTKTHCKLHRKKEKEKS